MAWERKARTCWASARVSTTAAASSVVTEMIDDQRAWSNRASEYLHSTPRVAPAGTRSWELPSTGTTTVGRGQVPQFLRLWDGATGIQTVGKICTVSIVWIFDIFSGHHHEPQQLSSSGVDPNRIQTSHALAVGKMANVSWQCWLRQRAD